MKLGLSVLIVFNFVCSFASAESTAHHFRCNASEEIFPLLGKILIDGFTLTVEVKSSAAEDFEVLTFQTRQRQESRARVWSNGKRELAVALKATEVWGEVYFNGAYAYEANGTMIYVPLWCYKN